MDILQEIVRMFRLDSVEQIDRDKEIYGENGFLSFRSKIRVTQSNGELVKAFVKLSDTSRAELGDMQEASNHFCRNECIFYCIMAPILDKIFSRCQLPQPYPVTFGHKLHSSGTILVMEDLMEQGYYLPKKMLSLTEAMTAVETLARVQAAYWIARTDMDYSMDDAIFGSRSPFCELIQQASREGRIDAQKLTDGNSEYFLENVGDFVKDKDDVALIVSDIKRLLPKILGTFKGTFRYSASLPTGLNHGDFWLSNFMFKEADSSLTCKILDWQIWSVGPLTNDLGIFFLSSLPNELFVKERINIFNHFYSTFKEIFEAGSGQQVPISYEDANESLMTGMFNGVMWMTVVMKIVMVTGVLPAENLLANLIYTLRNILDENEIKIEEYTE